jgi:hypothetical protein
VTDSKAIGHRRQGLAFDKNHSQDLIPSLPRVGRLQEERRVHSMVHGGPPCKLSSNFASQGSQLDTIASSPPRAKTARKREKPALRAGTPVRRKMPAARHRTEKLDDTSRIATPEFSGKPGPSAAKVSSHFGPRKSALNDGEPLEVT